MIYSLLAKRNTEVENLSRQDRKYLQQREEMLRAALKLFSEKGYHNVSMHEIAKAAEFGIGTLYRYFNNKDELYRALIMDLAQEFHEEMAKALEQEGDPLQAITRYVTARQRLFSDHLPAVRLYFEETKGISFNVKAGMEQGLLNLYDEVLKKLASVFEQGITDHIFRDADPYQMALALDAILNAALLESIRNPDRAPGEDTLSSIVDLFFKGVMNP